MKASEAGSGSSDDRVVFDFPVRKNGQTDFEEIPFIIAILANLSGRVGPAEQSRNPCFMDVRPGTINELMEGIRPSVRLSIPVQTLSEPAKKPATLELEFRSLEDFEPLKIAIRLAPVRELLSERIGAEVSVEDGFQSRSIAGDRSSNVERNAKIDKEIAKYLDTMLHDESFMRLHASWLGLARILKSCAPVPSTKIAVLDITKEELTSAESAPDQGITVSEELRGALIPLSSEIYGGHPPVALLADFEFSFKEAKILSALARTAEAIGTVLIAAAGADFMPRDSFTLINDRIDIHHRNMGIFEGWRRFRDEIWSRYAFLTLPTVLLRRPYERLALKGDADPPCYYDESTNPADRSGYLWGNGVYVIACLMAASFAKYGWVAAISPLDSSDLTLEYPIHRCENNLVPASVGPTFMPVWHDTSKVLSDLGFLPLIECKGTSAVAVFEDHACFSSQSPKPKPGLNEASAHLLYSLALYRLRHSFELIKRHKDLAAHNDRQLEHELRAWLSKFKPPGLATNTEPKGRWPLESFEINFDSSSNITKVEVTLSINYGNRCAPGRFEITGPTRSANKSPAPDPLRGSFEADLSVGEKAKSTEAS